MIGMRNRMIHVYDGIDMALVWTTARKPIPELLTLVEPLASPEPSPSPGSEQGNG